MRPRLLALLLALAILLTPALPAHAQVPPFPGLGTMLTENVRSFAKASAVYLSMPSVPTTEAEALQKYGYGWAAAYMSLLAIRYGPCGEFPNPFVERCYSVLVNTKFPDVHASANGWQILTFYLAAMRFDYNNPNASAIPQMPWPLAPQTVGAMATRTRTATSFPGAHPNPYWLNIVIALYTQGVQENNPDKIILALIVYLYAQSACEVVEPRNASFCWVSP